MRPVLSWSLAVDATLLRQVLHRLHVAADDAARREASWGITLLPHLRFKVLVLQLFIEDRYA